MHDGGHDVDSDEAPEDHSRCEPPLTELVAHGSRPWYESVDADVYAGGDEDRRDNDHEVLDHEPDDVVWIILGRQGAEYVSDGFKETGQGEWSEEPDFVADQLKEMDGKTEGEEDDGNYAKSKRWGIAVAFRHQQSSQESRPSGGYSMTYP